MPKTKKIEITETTENTDMIQTKAVMKADKPWLFKKGQSGNPAGKPKGSLSLTAAIKRRLRELTPDGKREAIEMLADNIIQDALDSSDKMRKLIWNYLDGLPKAEIDLTSGGVPLWKPTEEEKQQALKALDEP